MRSKAVCLIAFAAVLSGCVVTNRAANDDFNPQPPSAPIAPATAAMLAPERVPQAGRLPEIRPVPSIRPLAFEPPGPQTPVVRITHVAEAWPVERSSNVPLNLNSVTIAATQAEPARLPLPAPSEDTVDSDPLLRTPASPPTPISKPADAAESKAAAPTQPRYQLERINDFVSSQPKVGEPRITIEAIEQLAFDNNPAILQAAANVGKALGTQRQVGLRPNPVLGYFGEEIGNDGASGLHGVYLSQTLVRGHKLRMNRQVIGFDVERARLQLAVQRYRVRTDIRMQFIEALAAQQRLELAQQFSQVAREGVELSQALIEAKEAARPDLLQTELQLSEVELAIEQARLDLRGAWNELVSLAGLCELPMAPLAGDLRVSTARSDFDSTFSAMCAANPLLDSACTRVGRAQATCQRQQAQSIPNLNAQFGVGHDNGTGDEFANVQLSMPIPIHNANEGNIQAAHAELSAATQNVQRIEKQIRRQLASTLRDYDVADATVRTYESSIVPKAKESLELLLFAQRAGEADFLRVLTARRTYFDSNVNYIDALRRRARANAQLEGLLLTGGLSGVEEYDATDELRSQALSQQ